MLRTSLLTDPQQPDVVQHWVHIRQKMCLWPVLPDGIPGLSPDELLRHSGPLAALAISDRIALQTEIGAGWILRKTSAAPARLSPPGGYRHDRIRIGYMSSDFCSHAMSYLIAELFERHDRMRFDVYRLLREPRGWQRDPPPRDGGVRPFPVDPHPGRRGCRAADRTGRDRHPHRSERAHAGGASCRSCAGGRRRCSATYLGFVGPVPVPELDYLFCDDIVVPPAVAAAYAPKPLAIAANYQANDSKREIGAAITRAEAGLPDRSFRVLLLFEPLQDHARDVRLLDGDPAAGGARGSVADRGQ